MGIAVQKALLSLLISPPAYAHLSFAHPPTHLRFNGSYVKVRRLDSMSIFSILNYPCSFAVHY